MDADGDGNLMNPNVKINKIYWERRLSCLFKLKIWTHVGTLNTSIKGTVCSFGEYNIFIRGERSFAPTQNK